MAHTLIDWSNLNAHLKHCHMLAELSRAILETDFALDGDSAVDASTHKDYSKRRS